MQNVIFHLVQAAHPDCSISSGRCDARPGPGDARHTGMSRHWRPGPSHLADQQGVDWQN